jgi:hypothetical protein
MVEGEVRPFREGQAVELAAEGEEPVADVLQLEIGPEGGVIEGELFLPQLLGGIPPVPRGQLVSAAPAVDEGLEL